MSMLNFFFATRANKIGSKGKMAELIEFYVNNPDMPMSEIGKRFGIKGETVSKHITKYYLGVPDSIGQAITLQSKINEE